MSTYRILNINSFVAPEVEAAELDQINIPSNDTYPLVSEGMQREGADAFAVLRARLLNLCESRKVKSVILTSAERCEGKTMIAANLGATLGQLPGRRILLIDADFRLRSLTRLFGAETDTGLSEALYDRTHLDRYIRRTSIGTLSFMPAGLIQSDDYADMLQDNHWHDLIEQLKVAYDFILVDCLPVNVPVPDFELLTRDIEGVVMVVKLRGTHRDSLHDAVALVPPKKLLGLVVNNAVKPKRYMYNYGSKTS